MKTNLDKNVEQKANEAREYAESIINTVREPLIALDQDLRVVTVSRSFYDFFKVKPEETVGQLIYDLGNKQWDIPKLRELLETILPQKTSFDNYEVEHDFTTIGRRIMLLNARQIQRVLGKERIILLAIEDITERKRAEDAMRELKEYAESIIATIREPLIVLDAQLKVVSANHSFYETFKVVEKETIGNNLYDLGNRQWDIPKLRELLEKILPQNTKVSDYEVEHEFPQLGKRTMLLNARRIYQEANKTQIILLAIEDITKAKILERSREEFFSIASHELRTPLTAIRGNTALIQQFYADRLKDGELGEMIADIHDSSTRLIKIVNDFLEVSRLELSRIEYKKKIFDLVPLIENVSKELESVASEKRLYLKTEKPKTPLPSVFADKDKTKQVLMNLVDNGLKFTQKGGVTVFVSQEKDFLKVSITDTGIGISKTNQELLFRKFQQAEKNIFTRDVTRGTGLGLYISKLIVEGLGGKIYLESSEEGKGSTFVFTLPIAKSEKGVL